MHLCAAAKGLPAPLLLRQPHATPRGSGPFSRLEAGSGAGLALARRAGAPRCPRACPLPAEERRSHCSVPRSPPAARPGTDAPGTDAARQERLAQSPAQCGRCPPPRPLTLRLQPRAPRAEAALGRALVETAAQAGFRRAPAPTDLRAFTVSWPPCSQAGLKPTAAQGKQLQPQKRPEGTAPAETRVRFEPFTPPVLGLPSSDPLPPTPPSQSHPTRPFVSFGDFWCFSIITKSPL